MDVYSKAIEKIERGSKFSIDLAKRTLSIDKKRVKLKDQNLGINRIDEMPRILTIINELYSDFRTSVPSETADSNQGRYFRALDIESLTDEQLAHGENRQIARFRLEFFILCQLIYGTFIWDDELLGGTWFYQSQIDKSLVIRKESLGL